MQFSDASVSSKVPTDNNRRDAKAGKDDEIIAVKDAEVILLTLKIFEVLPFTIMISAIFIKVVF